jgi:hypothetical protein
MGCPVVTERARIDDLLRVFNKILGTSVGINGSLFAL